jgi:hypothetical protein
VGHTEISSLNRGRSLPHFYDEDRLVILPRDPRCIFAYWELSTATRERVEKQAGGEHQPFYVLRVYQHARNDAENTESYFELHPGREDASWYITVPEPDRLYSVELGWISPQGSFQVLLHSNKIRTPRDSISEIIDEEWQLPDWKAQKLFRRISLHHLSSAEFMRRVKK